MKTLFPDRSRSGRKNRTAWASFQDSRTPAGFLRPENFTFRPRRFAIECWYPGLIRHLHGFILGIQSEFPENFMQRARWIKSGQVGLLASVGAMLALMGLAPSSIRAADKAQGEVVPLENKLLQTTDGGTLHI